MGFGHWNIGAVDTGVASRGSEGAFKVSHGRLTRTMEALREELKFKCTWNMMAPGLPRDGWAAPTEDVIHKQRVKYKGRGSPITGQALSSLGVTHRLTTGARVAARRTTVGVPTSRAQQRAPWRVSMP